LGIEIILKERAFGHPLPLILMMVLVLMLITSTTGAGRIKGGHCLSPVGALCGVEPLKL
jgi:hypothetical protein